MQENSTYQGASACVRGEVWVVARTCGVRKGTATIGGELCDGWMKLGGEQNYWYTTVASRGMPNARQPCQYFEGYPTFNVSAVAHECCGGRRTHKRVRRRLGPTIGISRTPRTRPRPSRPRRFRCRRAWAATRCARLRAIRACGPWCRSERVGGDAGACAQVRGAALEALQRREQDAAAPARGAAVTHSSRTRPPAAYARTAGPRPAARLRVNGRRRRRCVLFILSFRKLQEHLRRRIRCDNVNSAAGYRHTSSAHASAHKYTRMHARTRGRMHVHARSLARPSPRITSHCPPHTCSSVVCVTMQSRMFSRPRAASSAPRIVKRRRSGRDAFSRRTGISWCFRN